MQQARWCGGRGRGGPVSASLLASVHCLLCPTSFNSEACLLRPPRSAYPLWFRAAPSCPPACPAPARAPAAPAHLLTTVPVPRLLPAPPAAAAQVFKICLEYWNFFVPDVYSSVCTLQSTASPVQVRRAGLVGWFAGLGRGRADGQAGQELGRQAGAAVAAAAPVVAARVYPRALLAVSLLRCSRKEGACAAPRSLGRCSLAVAAPQQARCPALPLTDPPPPLPRRLPLAAVFLWRRRRGGSRRRRRGAQGALPEDAQPAAGAHDRAHGQARGGAAWCGGVGDGWLLPRVAGCCPRRHGLARQCVWQGEVH